MNDIQLRMIAFKEQDGWTMVCLETYIAVQAGSWEELEAKMRDATILYFDSFTPGEIQAEKYIRKAPLWYRIQWSFRATVLRALGLLSGPLKAIFDPQSALVRFA